jgi:hypothetical protein
MFDKVWLAAMGTETLKIERRVGRLIETRIHGMLAVDDVQKMRDSYQAIYATTELRYLSAIDVRAAVTQGQDKVGQQLLRLFQDTNPRVERTAILVGADVLMPIQVEALILKAHHPGRRLFREVAPFVEFLGELATEEERTRLAAFLQELASS